MLEEKALRKADLVTSVLLVAAGVAIVATALGFPKGQDLSGVRNDWYVSPGLIPIVLGLLLGGMGLGLFFYALKRVDTQTFLAEVKARLSGTDERGMSPKSWRFLGVTLVIVFTVYLFLPRVDFILSSMLFVLTLMSMFHFKDDALVKKVLGLYLLLCLPVLLYYATGLGRHFEKRFYFSGDVVAGALALVYVVALGSVCARSGGTERRSERRKKWLHLCLITIAYILLLTPVFKFVFYIPLPREGGIIELMNIVYYDVLGQ